MKATDDDGTLANDQNGPGEVSSWLYFSPSRAVPTFAPAATEEPDPSRCLQVDMPPGGGEIELPDLPGARGVVIRTGDELVYDVLPVAGSGDRAASSRCNV